MTRIGVSGILPSRGIRKTVTLNGLSIETQDSDLPAKRLVLWNARCFAGPRARDRGLYEPLNMTSAFEKSGQRLQEPE